MGYAFNGRCYVDGAAALKAFDSQFPVIEAASVATLSSSSVNGTGKISYQLVSRNMATQSNVTNISNLQMQACTPDDLTYASDWSVILVIGCVALFGLGFIATK